MYFPDKENRSVSKVQIPFQRCFGADELDNWAKKNPKPKLPYPFIYDARKAHKLSEDEQLPKMSAAALECSTGFPDNTGFPDSRIITNAIVTGVFHVDATPSST